MRLAKRKGKEMISETITIGMIVVELLIIIKNIKKELPHPTKKN